MRLRRPVARQQRLDDFRRGLLAAEHQFQRATGLADDAADAEQIAHLRPGAGQRLPGRHPAEHGDGHAQRATRGIAADQRQTAVVRHPVEAAGETFQPGGIGRRQGQRERECKRGCAHRRQVAGGYRQGALAEQEGIADFGKVHPGDQGVGGNRQLFAGGQCQQGAVVADAQCHAFGPGRTGGRGEVAADQFELTHADGRSA
ncbi:hypothetical protein D3C78_1058010 [compost metagenome]